MATKELSMRTNWQTLNNMKALGTEDLFHKTFQFALDTVSPNKFLVDKHPSEFGDIYSNYTLPQDTLNKIYDVDVSKKSWGISMDFAIRNLQNGKILFGEIKRQDGWVETTNMQAGRGNAHERCCKYFTPGLMKILRQTSKISSKEILPFWIIFVGDITRDPRRNREIAFWFQEYTSNYYMWRDTSNVDDILNFFENNLLKHLL